MIFTKLLYRGGRPQFVFPGNATDLPYRENRSFASLGVTAEKRPIAPTKEQ